MNEDNEVWTNSSNTSDQSGDMDELYRLVDKFATKRLPSTIEAGARMYALIRDKFTPAEPGLTYSRLTGMQIFLLEDLAPEIAHVRDRDGKLMETFLLVDGDEGPKITIFKHRPPEFNYDIQRIPQAATPRPGILGRMEPNAASAANHPYDGHGAERPRLESSGSGTEDESEPGQDQEG